MGQPCPFLSHQIHKISRGTLPWIGDPLGLPSAMLCIHCRQGQRGGPPSWQQGTQQQQDGRPWHTSERHCVLSALNNRNRLTTDHLQHNVLWSKIIGQRSHTVQQQLLLHEHHCTTSTECYLMHYGRLPHMVIGCMHNSLNHSLPLTVCMALTFFLYKRSAPKVSHSSCTTSLWPLKAESRRAVQPS